MVEVLPMSPSSLMSSTPCGDGHDDGHVPLPPPLSCLFTVACLVWFTVNLARRQLAFCPPRVSNRRRQAALALFTWLALVQVSSLVHPLFLGIVSRHKTLSFPQQQRERWGQALSFSFVTLVEASGKRPRCMRLGYLSGVAREALGNDFSNYGNYFCADTAPETFSCSCELMSKCVRKQDRWQRNVGECVCCRAWLWVLIAFCVATAMLVVVFFVSFVPRRRRWYIADYPPPISYQVPRENATVVCPPEQPFAEGTFYGYPSSHFANYYSAEYQQRMHDAALAQESAAPREGGGRKNGADAAEGVGGGRAANAGTGLAHKRRARTAAMQPRWERVAAETPPKQPFGPRQEAEFAKREREEREQKARTRSVEPFAAEDSLLGSGSYDDRDRGIKKCGTTKNARSTFEPMADAERAAQTPQQSCNAGGLPDGIEELSPLLARRGEQVGSAQGTHDAGSRQDQPARSRRLPRWMRTPTQGRSSEHLSTGARQRGGIEGDSRASSGSGQTAEERYRNAPFAR